jgi:acetolactate synthase-1/2/3 large subunit
MPPLPSFAYDSPSRRVPASPPAPDDGAIAAAAELLATTGNPLIVTVDAGPACAAAPALAAFAEEFAIPVVEHWPRHLNLPADHPCHLGYSPAALLDDADGILVVDCDVPWTPSRKAPSPDCKVVQTGVDPLFSCYPIRGFPCRGDRRDPPRAAATRRGDGDAGRQGRGCRATRASRGDRRVVARSLQERPAGRPSRATQCSKHRIA